MEKVDFEIRLVHNKPVDLIQMANSLISLQNIISSFVGKENGIKDSKILLKGVKEGSDIYQLALDFGSEVLPFINGTGTVIEAINHIKTWALSKSKKEILSSKHYNSVNCDNMKNLVAPVVTNDDNRNMSIKVGDNNNAPIVINNFEAKQISENADYIKSLISSYEKEEDNTLYQKKLIKMYKATDSVKQVKDSSYCDDIVKGKAIATIFENPQDKKEVLTDPFSNLFLVDIEVNKINDEIKLYRVLKLHNIIPIEIE